MICLVIPTDFIIITAVNAEFWSGKLKVGICCKMDTIIIIQQLQVGAIRLESQFKCIYKLYSWKWTQSSKCSALLWALQRRILILLSALITVQLCLDVKENLFLKPGLPMACLTTNSWLDFFFFNYIVYLRKYSFGDSRNCLRIGSYFSKLEWLRMEMAMGDLKSPNLWKFHCNHFAKELTGWGHCDFFSFLRAAFNLIGILVRMIQLSLIYTSMHFVLSA